MKKLSENNIWLYRRVEVCSGYGPLSRMPEYEFNWLLKLATKAPSFEELPISYQEIILVSEYITRCNDQKRNKSKVS